MSSKTNAEVIIGGKVYTLSGYEGEEYLQKVAAYINGKIAEVDALEGVRRMPGDMRNILIQLNIADDLFKAREQVEKLEEDLEAKENEIYDLKQELVDAQLKMESAQKETEDLQEENKELKFNKSRLESSLEEVLFDQPKAERAEESITKAEEKESENEDYFGMPFIKSE